MHLILRLINYNLTLILNLKDLNAFKAYLLDQVYHNHLIHLLVYIFCIVFYLGLLYFLFNLMMLIPLYLLLIFLIYLGIKFFLCWYHLLKIISYFFTINKISLPIFKLIIGLLMNLFLIHYYLNFNYFVFFKNQKMQLFYLESYLYLDFEDFKEIILMIFLEFNYLKYWTIILLPIKFTIYIVYFINDS